MIVVGHRGAAAHALENTAASFEKASQFEVDMIEFDIRESLDGEFMVIHDAHLGRISSRRDIIKKTHSRTLKSIELYNGQRLLTLGEACAMIPRRIGLMIEIKTIKSLSKVANLIEIEMHSREVLVTSFDLNLLLRLQALSTHLSLGAVAKTVAELSGARAQGLKARAACVDYRALKPDIVSRLRTEWEEVFAWTVDGPSDIAAMVGVSVDGIISNRPDEVSRTLARIAGEQIS
jgi:glycerophosphoryl diester phosphodiesterase